MIRFTSRFNAFNNHFIALKCSTKYFSLFGLIFSLLLLSHAGESYHSSDNLSAKFTKKMSMMPDEICDNGIDDDMDGLYDSYDPDCPCEQAAEPLSYITNGDFESISECCVGMSESEGTCLENWFLVTESPDYVSPGCSDTDFALFDLEGIPYTGGFIATGPSNEADGNVRTESLGICLDSPLKACRDYTITFNAIILSILDFSPNQEDLYYTIYGIEQCSSADFVVSESFCTNPLSADAQEILSFNVNEMDRDEWFRFVGSFSPDFDINALVIYVRCNQNVSVTGTPFLFFDNFEFLTGTVDCSISGQIDVVGDSCTNNFMLTALASNGVTYQWYKDSIPLLGADSSTYSPEFEDNTGAYSVLVSNNVECVLLDPVDLTTASTMNITLFDTICSGQEFYYGFDTLIEPGKYIQSLGIGPNGCEILEIQNLFVHPHLEAVFDFSPGLTIPIGTTLTISPQDGFLSQIESFEWTENGQVVSGATATLTRTSTVVGQVSYSMSYTHSRGCAQSASFIIEWISIGPQPEVCDNNIDDDQDGLVDTFDDDCPCTADNTDSIQIDTSICFGASYLFGEEELTESGIYTDSLVNAINCDSIITLALTVLPDQIDTTSVSIFDGDGYDFFGTLYFEEGWYSFVDDNNESDCDSTHYLHLQIDIPLSVYIPNAISLGSSSGNDKFYITPNKAVVITDLYIYNRWGNLIFQRDRIDIVGDDPYIWDGTFQNENVSRGLYVYTLTYTDGQVTEHVRGDITVME